MKRLTVSVFALLLMLLLCFSLASPAFAEGQAPVAQNLELKTYRNITRSIFTRKSPKELFIRYFNEL